MAGEHARALASLPNAEIVGVCGRTASRAEALAGKYSARTYQSIDVMYRKTEADAVVVAVNEPSVAEVALACFAHPWACLLEKPVGVDLPQAEAILAASRRNASPAYVALNRRSYAATRRAVAEIEHDPGPRLISILDQQDLDAARNAGQPEIVVRNYMYANSIHLIDYFKVFGRGEIVSVAPIAAWSSERPTFVVASIRYSSGDLGLYEAVWNGPGPWSVAVSNDRVRVEMRPLEKLSIQLRHERRATEIAADPIDTSYKPGLRYQAEQLIASLEGAPTKLPPLEEATQSMALCADIYGLRPPRAA